MDCQADADTLALPFKRLLLQPLVENSISHGIRPSAKPGRIMVRIFIRDTRLVVQCADNGVGIPPEKLEALRNSLNMNENGRSIGLNNVNRRLVLNYGDGSALRLFSLPGYGTGVMFTIPLESLQPAAYSAQ